MKQQLGRNRTIALIAGFYFLLRNHRQMKIELEAGKDAREFQTSTLFVGNNTLQLKQVGILDEESQNDPMLKAIMLKPTGKLAMLRLILRGALGTLRDEENIVSFPFAKMRVARPMVFGHRIKVAIDGEVEWLNNPLNFQIAPRPLYIVKPKFQDDSAGA